MSTPGNPSVDPRLIAQLSGDFSALGQQMRHVGENLAILQAQLSTVPQPSPAPAPAPGPVAQPGWAQAPQPMYRPPAPQPPSPQPSAALPPVAQAPPPVQFRPAPIPPPRVAREPWWQRDGVISRILAVAGVGVTLIGVVMLLVLAAQAGFFGPGLRVAAGAILSVVLVVLGTRVLGRPGGRVGGIALTATGIAGAYLDVVAVAVVYHWLLPALAMVVALGVAGVGVALAVRWASQPLALLVVTGAAVLAPVLTDGITLTLIGFLYVIQVAGFPAQLGRTWPYLAIARTIPVVIALLIAIADIRVGDGQERNWALASAALVALFGLVSSIMLLRRSSRDITATAMIVTTAVPMLLVSDLFSRVPSTSIALTLAAAMFGAWMVVRPLPLHARSALAGTGTLALLLACLVGAGDEVAPLVLLGVATLFLTVGGQASSRLAYAVGAAFAMIGGLAFLDSAPPFVLVDEYSAVDLLGITTVLSGLVLVGTVVLLVWYAHSLQLVKNATAQTLWVLAGLVVLYAVTTVTVSVGTAITGTSVGFIAGHCVATIVWMAAATAALVFGLAHREYAHTALGAGLALTAAALVKLFVFDLAMLDGLFRVLAFLVVGLLLLLAGTRYAREFAERDTGRGAPGQSVSADSAER
ncbi:DUF2339 domain-containing protein [Rhodococcus tibetensis]|uniref:DUF2339 domain-containing protein n=1 Tax=Rhodococcus tibetensis TaxID=2965064 RepID=A0ABT1QJ64_9NOCA|nr:DUF2339 domain-containing protein [Rhodococcus sp. FXJ9.536]MCQ4121120.1 DUF2339 domain-containing protein [Rhodococcus sp. FXJ9.536]